MDFPAKLSLISEPRMPALCCESFAHKKATSVEMASRLYVNRWQTCAAAGLPGIKTAVFYEQTRYQRVLLQKGRGLRVQEPMLRT